MKKLMFVVMMLFGSTAVAEPTMMMAPTNVHNVGALPGVVLLAGAGYLAFTDEVQACDKLPIIEKKAPNGNYTFDVAGCDQ